MDFINIGAGNGLSPGQFKAITRTNADLLSIGPFEIKLCEILIKISWQKLEETISWIPHVMTMVCGGVVAVKMEVIPESAIVTPFWVGDSCGYRAFSACLSHLIEK